MKEEQIENEETNDETDAETLRDKIAKSLVEKADGEYKDYHDPFVELGNKIYFAYIGKDADGEDVEEDWRSRVYPKTVKVKVLAAASQMMPALMNNKDPFTIEPNAGESNAAGAPLMRETILEQWDKADFAEKQKVSVMDLLMYGNCCFEAPVTVNYDERTWQIDALRTLQSLIAMEGKRYYKPKITKKDAPGLFNRNVFDMRLFPYSSDIQDGEGVFHRPFISKYQLIDLLEREGFDKDAIKDAIKNGPDSASGDDAKDDKLSARGYTGKDRKGYDYLHFSGKLDAEVLHKAGYAGFNNVYGYTEVLAHVINCSDKPRLIKLAKNPMPNKKRPFLWCVYERVPYETRGVGIGENVLDMSDLVKGATRLYIDAKKMALPMIAMDPSKRSAGSNIEFRPFKTYLFQGDPKQWIKEFQFTDVSDGLMVLIEFAERLMDEISGIPKWTTGIDSKMLNKTAAGMSMIMNAQGQLMRGAIENYNDMIIEPMAEAFYDWNMEFHPDHRIKGNYRITANGLAVQIAKDVINQQLMQLVSYVINPAIARNPNAVKLLRMIGTNMGIKDVDSVLPDPEKLLNIANELRVPEAAPEAGMISQPPMAVAGPMAGVA